MKVCTSLKSYYLGYYIPTCPKMRYKSKITPSFLLCPEAFTFHILDEKLSNLVDSVKYTKINESGIDADFPEKSDLKKVLVIVNRTVCKYADYRLVSQFIILTCFKTIYPLDGTVGESKRRRKC